MEAGGTSIDIGINITPYLYLHVGSTEYKFNAENIVVLHATKDAGCVVMCDSVEYEVKESQEDINNAILEAKCYKNEAITHINSLLKNCKQKHSILEMLKIIKSNRNLNLIRFFYYIMGFYLMMIHITRNYQKNEMRFST